MKKNARDLQATSANANCALNLNAANCPIWPAPGRQNESNPALFRLFWLETLDQFWPAELPEGFNRLTREQQRTWKQAVLAYGLRDLHRRS